MAYSNNFQTGPKSRKTTTQETKQRTTPFTNVCGSPFTNVCGHGMHEVKHSDFDH